MLNLGDAGADMVFAPPLPRYPSAEPRKVHGALSSWLQRRERSVSTRFRKVSASEECNHMKFEVDENHMRTRRTERSSKSDTVNTSNDARTEHTSRIWEHHSRSALPEPLRPYRWQPVHVRSLPADALSEYFMGAHVNTLSLQLEVEASWEPLCLAPDNFRPEGNVCCCHMDSSLVLCRGILVGACPQEHAPESGRSILLARLPDGMRPRHALQFAAQCEELDGARGRMAADGHSSIRSHLVTLIVTPDGWISGFGLRDTEGAVDLSAVRFSTSRGMALTDAVRAHVCDVSGDRMVVLQGPVAERQFGDYRACSRHCSRLLLELPEICQPQHEQAFIVAGGRNGGFHLIRTKFSPHVGSGGGLEWADCVYNRDSIHLSGLLYRAAPQVAQLPLDINDWIPMKRFVVVRDFQNLLQRKFTSCEVAWHRVFDVSGRGHVDFSEFAQGCKISGFCGNVTRLWSMLDEHGRGQLTLHDLSANEGAREPWP